jgi:hypothetical protein
MNGHAVTAFGQQARGVDASYLANLNAPFDWEEAQRRVLTSALPAN